MSSDSDTRCLKVDIPQPYNVGTCDCDCPAIYHDPEDGAICTLGLAEYPHKPSFYAAVAFWPGLGCPWHDHPATQLLHQALITERAALQEQRRLKRDQQIAEARARRAAREAAQKETT